VKSLVSRLLASPSGLPHWSRVGLVAVLLAAGTALVTHSSSEGHERDVLQESLRRGADRLVGLQQANGGWAQAPGAKADLAGSGSTGRALLMAWEVTQDPRYFLASRRAARAIAAEVAAGRGVNAANLGLLRSMGEASGQPAFGDVARAAWLQLHRSTSADAGAASARRLLSLPCRGTWTPGDWRNYLLMRAAEEADLARSLGHDAWADAFLLEAAGAWSPKHDHDYWASAAGGMLGALGRSQDPRARRYELAHRGLLETNELIDGVAWNDTPYDTYVYLSETSASLAGRIRDEGGARPRTATFAGLEFLASRQAPHGGWGAVLSVIEEVAAEGDEETAPAAEAVEESPALNALAVEALALGLGAAS
jgi:hypothetical protein